MGRNQNASHAIDSGTLVNIKKAVTNIPTNVQECEQKLREVRLLIFGFCYHGYSYSTQGQQKHADIGEVQSFEPFVAEELSFNQPWCDHNALAYGELPSPILNVDISPLLTQLPSCNSLLPLGLEESLPAQTLIDEL